MNIRQRLSHLKSYAGIVLLFLVVLFAAQNAEIVTINFMFWEFSMSRAIMIFLLLVTGFIIGRIYSSLQNYKK